MNERQLHVTEEALRESEERFRSTFENAAVGIAHNDSAGRFLRVNEKFCTIVGYSRGELLQKTLQDIIHPEDLVAHCKLYESCFAQGEAPSVGMELRYLRKDGSTVYVEAFASFQRDVLGRPSYAIGVVQDITERKRLEEEMQRRVKETAEAEERMRSVVNHVVDGIITIDDQGSVLSFNPAAENIFGYSAQEVIGQNIKMLMPEPHYSQHDGYLAHYLRTGQAKIIGIGREVVGRRKNGAVFPLDLAISVFRLGQGQYFTGIVRDITDRKRAEEALRESEQRWRSLTDALPQLIWSATPDGACDYFSTQVTQFTGVPEAELLGSGWLTILHPEDRESTRRFWLESIESKRPYDVEFRLCRHDGQYRWFKTRAVPVLNGGESVIKWFGTSTDITDLRKIEEALRESEQGFRGTFENAAVGIAHEDLEGRFLRLNEKFGEILGYSPGELVGRTFTEVTYAEDLAADLAKFGALRRGESSNYTMEKRFLRKDGSLVWAELTVSLQLDAAGKPNYCIKIIRDINDRKRAEEALREAMAAAEAGNRAKDEFLANVSHEIRTPMNAILGMTELALDTPLTEDQRQCLTTVKSAADNLLVIINDLLDFSKIEAGKLELDVAAFRLRTTVGDTLRALAVRAHKKGLELIYHVQPEVPDALVGDSGRLRQVLLNLVGNAIKFTDEGEVVVRVEAIDGPRISASEAGDINLCFTVQDTGIGIPQEKQERIFRAFEQEDTSTTRRYGGTGLGLTISARLVALMGGQITVNSEPGRGSTFAFTARFGRLPHQPEQLAVRPPVLLHGLRVLIVDDNATNRHILQEWLHSWQMDAAAVGDGLAALDALWDAVSTGQPYALVLLDARMPDTDGLAIAASIRKRVELSATRIILLTSGDRPGDIARSREQRVNAHLLKPVRQDELLETIYQVMSRGNGNFPPTVKPVEERQQLQAPNPRPLSILVAEDNEFNAQLLEQMLGRRGHHVRLAGDGREALRLVAETAFDLLLLDVHMPELDGFQVAQALREREQTTGGHLPIIALTARSRKEDRERCLAAGMDDFLAKPIQAADLWTAIDRVVVAATPVDLPGPDLLDPPVLLAAYGGDAEFFEKMCQAFLARLPDRLKSVQDALKDRDATRLREAAHKFTGMVAAFSTVVGGVASELEDVAEQGQLDEAQPLVARLEVMTDELLRVVSGLSLESLRSRAKGGAEPGP